MVSVKRHSISTFVTKTFWIFLIIFHQFNLVICDLDDDNLKKALEAIERRQRDFELQENEYYGQPEDIGYGFQKTLGFFDSNGPDRELGSFNSDSKNENDYQGMLYNYQRGRDGEKRKSNFRERMTNERNDREGYSQSGADYQKMLKNLWSKNRQVENDDLSIEDLTDEQLEDILSSMNDRDTAEEQFGNDYRSIQSNGLGQYEAIPLRSIKNYRVFEGLHDTNKRYPSFGEGIYGKRSYHSQHLGYESPPENDFPYSMKYTNPEMNADMMDASRETGFEDIMSEKERNLMKIFNNAMNRPTKYIENDEPYWTKDQNNYDDELWLPGAVSFQDDWYDGSGRNEKRMEVTPKYFKQHNGIALNLKRLSAKRSPIRVRKEVKNEKVSKELKGIFGTVSPPKKGNEKKPTEILKKQNITKPAVTIHHENKKVVRSADKLTKERVLPSPQNEEVSNLLKVNKKSNNKKSIDWSQYFGIDKRSQQSWLNKDYINRAESHVLGPQKNGYYPGDRDGTDRLVLERTNYQMPFDTRLFSKKSYTNDIGSNIDKVESKIGDIEEKIIDDALKYTGAHSGVVGEDLSRVKGRVIQNLEAAYSLEKMKNALEEFKNLIKPEKSLANSKMPKKSATEAPKSEVQTTSPALKESAANLEKPLLDRKQSSGEIAKRPAVKKEGVKDIFNREPENLEFLNDGSNPARQYEDEECPVLDQIMHNCLRLEEMGGKYAELLVPLCSLQQICYFCGAEIGFSKMSMCDSMYLTEARNICQDNRECLMNARDSLVGLRDLYEQAFMGRRNGGRLLSGTCLSNPCIQKFFLNSPGAVYSLDVGDREINV